MAPACHAHDAEPAAISTTSSPTRRGRLVRSRHERVLAGVAGGLGARIGVDPVLLRIALVVLSLAGGAGVVLYAIGWLVSDEPAPDEEPASRDLDLQQATAVGLIAIGVLLLLRGIGLWFADEVVWPALLVGIGSGVIWTRGGDHDLPTDLVGLRGGGPAAVGRIVAGSAIGAAGVLGLLTRVEEPVVAAATLGGVVLGLGLLVGPWLYRVWLQLGEERSERARAQAREEVAAHLHDSVLQTLALIQRSSDQPRRMVALARRQERELRAWLYGDDRTTATTLASAVDALVGEVEARYPVDVEPVVVGDRPMDGDLDALLAATREALVNVGKHAGVESASLYVEVEDHEVVVFVRDRGHGFDPDAVPEDRLGLRNSVRSRLERHGGRAVVHSRPGHGTEIELRQPLRRGREVDHEEHTA